MSQPGLTLTTIDPKSDAQTTAIFQNTFNKGSLSLSYLFNHFNQKHLKIGKSAWLEARYITCTAPYLNNPLEDAIQLPLNSDLPKTNHKFAHVTI